MAILPPAPDGTRIRALLPAYLGAEYRWQYEGDWHDIVVGLPHPGLELAFPEVATFGVLSAFNPMSIPQDMEANRRADDALHEILLASGYRFLPAFASARNRTWREPSWLVMGMPRGEFDALTHRLGQLGSLWWARGQPVRLRIDARRPEGADNDEFVDWLQ